MSRFQRSVASVAVAGVLVPVRAGQPAPVQSQTAPRKLDLAHIIAPPESGAIGFKYLADEVTKRSNGSSTWCSTAARCWARSWRSWTR
jgi:hypothetical protein